MGLSSRILLCQNQKLDINLHSVQESLDPRLIWEYSINEGYVNLRKLEGKYYKKNPVYSR